MVPFLARVSDWWIEASLAKIWQLLRGEDLVENISLVLSSGSAVLVGL